MPEHGAAIGEHSTARPSSAADARVAVLGGTGLIGSAISRSFLDAGHEVTVFARRPPDEGAARLLDGANLTIGDASERTALRRAIEGATIVVDALGAPHPAASAGAPLDQFDAEVPVLLGLLDELHRVPEVRFLYLSSGGAIYGDVHELPVAEDADCHPVSPYGVTKLAAERYVLMAANRDGLRARILRVANAYGALQRPGTGQGLLAVLFRAVRTSTPVEVFGDGSAIRDYVDARDVAHAAVSLASRADGAQVLNVGSGVGHAIIDVVALVESVTGASIEVHHEPARSSDVRAVVLDVSRLAGLVDWHPRALEAGVADAWRSWDEWVPSSRAVRAEAR